MQVTHSLKGRGPAGIADWLESLAVCFGEREPISKNRAWQIGQSFGDLPIHEVEQGFSHAVHRGAILTELYPFEITETYIVAKPGAGISPYFAMAALSSTNVFRYSRAWDQNFAAKFFENLAEKCLNSFFGHDTRTLNFGHPSSVGRPQAFEPAVQWLAENVGTKLGSSYRPPRRQDGGVDLFVWKSFSDSLPGTPILMVQCTIGEDYLLKIGDIDVRLWSGWLSSDLNPLVAIAVPKEVTARSEWDELSARGVLLDRMRLIRMAGRSQIEFSLAESNFMNRLISDFKAQVA